MIGRNTNVGLIFTSPKSENPKLPASPATYILVSKEAAKNHNAKFEIGFTIKHAL